jgi:hypothetical protein
MFTLFGLLISFAVATAAWVVLHGASRRFVRNRLRYVDAVQKGIAPWVAGAAAFVAGAVIVPFLPIVGIGTALTAGLAVGTGVAAGARDIRSGTSPIVYGG